MFSRFVAQILAVGLIASPLVALAEASAQTEVEGLTAEETPDADIAALYDVLKLSDIVHIMREEGLAYGDEIAVDLFGGRPNADWSAIVAAIYDPVRMEAQVRGALEEAIAGQDIDALIAFFSTPLGQNFLSLEISARRAMLDDGVETMAKEAASIAAADRTPRYQQLERFVIVNDLIETNVVGALNSSYSFYLGLMDGGAFPGTMTEDEILSNVWAQEPEIRANTTEWVYSFLMLAYDPLSDEDLEAYIAFSQTEAGVLLNRAIFGAFDGMFEDISLSLGRASSTFMVGEDL